MGVVPTLAGGCLPLPVPATSPAGVKKICRMDQFPFFTFPAVCVSGCHSFLVSSPNHRLFSRFALRSSLIRFFPFGPPLTLNPSGFGRGRMGPGETILHQLLAKIAGARFAQRHKSAAFGFRPAGVFPNTSPPPKMNRRVFFAGKTVWPVRQPCST